MWTRSCSKVFKSIKKEAIWERWSDVTTWHEWIPNIESCRIDKPFASGSSFVLKPKGSPEVTVKLVNVKKDQSFTGCTHFFGATMYDIHEMHQDPQGIRLTVTLKVTGPLAFLWRKLVAEKIEANLPRLLTNLAGAATDSDIRKPIPLIKKNTQATTKTNLHLISSVSQKQKVSQKKPQSKAKLTISTNVLQQTNPLLQSIPQESTISNRKVDSSMFTSAKPKPTAAKAKPKAKSKPKTKAKSKTKSKVKSKASSTKARKTKTTRAKATKAKTKSSTVKKAKRKTSTAASKKPKKKSTSASKKKTTKAKSKATKSKATKPKAKAKAAPKTKS